MGKLIRFDFAKKGKQDKKMCREQIKLIVNKHTVQKRSKNEYYVADAIQIAEEILAVYMDKPFGATPIFQVIRDFDFEVCNSDLNNFDEGCISGIIKVNGNTKDFYGTDKIIITNMNDPISHQRFVAAHELGHYIMDKVDSACNVPFAEIVTLTQIDHDGIFFVNQTRRFTTGDNLNLRRQALKCGEQHSGQQANPRDAQNRMAANELHNFLHGG